MLITVAYTRNKLDIVSIFRFFCLTVLLMQIILVFINTHYVPTRPYRAHNYGDMILKL